MRRRTRPVERRQHEDPGRLVQRSDPASGLDPVDPRHPHVHQHDVAAQLPRLRDGLDAVARFADDVEPGIGSKDHPKARADEVPVVGEEHPDHRIRSHSGKLARTTYPPPLRGPASILPPKTAARSRIPSRPWPLPSPFWLPTPSSATSMSTSSSP